MIDRVHRKLTYENITHITTACRAWRGDANTYEYVDVLGFSKSGTPSEFVDARIWR
jgi:hypothetical protein